MVTLEVETVPSLLRPSRERAFQVGRPLGGDTGRETEWLLLQSPWTEFFKSIELYTGDGLEMAGHLTLTLGKFCTVNAQYVYLCVQLEKITVLQEPPLSLQ